MASTELLFGTLQLGLESRTIVYLRQTISPDRCSTHPAETDEEHQEEHELDGHSELDPVLLAYVPGAAPARSRRKQL